MCSSSVHRPVFSPVVVVGGGAETWAAVGGWHIVVAVAARLRYVFFWAVLGGAFSPPRRVLTARGMPRSAGVCKRAAARELAPCRTASGRKRLDAGFNREKRSSPLLKLARGIGNCLLHASRYVYALRGCKLRLSASQPL